MRIIGCDLHARQQALAMLDTETGELVNLMLWHEGNEVREFYSQLPRPVLVGIEATGSMHWFLNLMEEPDVRICRIRLSEKVSRCSWESNVESAIPPRFARRHP